MYENIDYKLVWEKIVTEIKSKIGEKDFNRWFKLEFAEISQNKITLISTSRIGIDQINTRYPGIIENSLKNHFGGSIFIEFNYIEFNQAEEISNKQIKKTISRIPSIKEKETVKSQNSQFLDEFTFENYVIGENNNFAANAAQAVAKNPGSINYNPLFIYSGVGLGKTHLIQAIGNYTVKNSSQYKIIYKTGEEFFNEFVSAINDSQNNNKDTMKNFKRKYRETDILLIDDIHFLEGKEFAQEELFNTFNALYRGKKQMVFTCDRPVTELKKIADRLKSRLGSGISIDIQIPKYETRYAILIKKMNLLCIEIPNDVIDLICNNITSNVRDMISALNKLSGYEKLTNQKITLDIARNQLKDIFSSSHQMNISMETIIHVIAFHFGISISEIKGKSRKSNIIYPRQLAMYIARSITNFSTTEIGLSFERDHSTVLHSIEVIDKRKQNNPGEESFILSIIKKIKEQSVK